MSRRLAPILALLAFLPSTGACTKVQSNAAAPTAAIEAPLASALPSTDTKDWVNGPPRSLAGARGVVLVEVWHRL